MSVASDELAERIRNLIGHRPAVTDQRMFGGCCFMLNGNMVCGAMPLGTHLIRVAPGEFDEALHRPGAQPMRMGERQMTGFIEVTDDIEDDDRLRDWINLAWDYVTTMPPKPPKAPGKANSPRKRAAQKSS